MTDDEFERFAQEVKEKAMEIRAGICPIWQCGGVLEHIEDRLNWQEPDLRCKNCGAYWTLTRRHGDVEKSKQGDQHQ